MTYGIYNIKKAFENEIVRCNNCYHYFYDEIFGDERNDNSLQMLFDEDFKEYFMGCPVCETDDYLTDIDLTQFSEKELDEMQKDNGANFDEI